MLIKFEIRSGEDRKFIEWTLDATPRVGDFVSLGDDSGEVVHVMWVLVDDDTGKPMRAPYVQILIDSR